MEENDTIDIFHYHLGEAYRRKGDTDKAVAALNRAVELAEPGTSVAESARQSLALIN